MMKAIYRIKFSSQLIETMYERFDQHEKNRKSRYSSWITAAVFFLWLLFVGYGFYAGEKWAPVVLVTSIIPLTMYFMGNSSQLIRNRGKKLLLAQPDVVFTLTDDELQVASGVSSTGLAWVTQSSVSRFNDGFILAQNKLLRWLPDNALEGASVAEVDNFLRAKIASYKNLSE